MTVKAKRGAERELRRTRKVNIPVSVLIGLIDLPEGTRLLHCAGTMDPPGLTMVLSNPAWPEVEDNAESPWGYANTGLKVLEETGGVSKPYGRISVGEVV